jgi:MFS family permease
MQFMLIIWLQGIWLPLHGYDFERTPLWAGIFMLPLTAGFLLGGPASGYLSDRFGARLFSTTGLLLVAAAFTGLILLPVDFPYSAFAALLLKACEGQTRREKRPAQPATRDTGLRTRRQRPKPGVPASNAISVG